MKASDEKKLRHGNGTEENMPIAGSVPKSHCTDGALPGNGICGASHRRQYLSNKAKLPTTASRYYLAFAPGYTSRISILIRKDRCPGESASSKDMVLNKSCPRQVFRF